MLQPIIKNLTAQASQMDRTYDLQLPGTNVMS